ncbi:uncharacterized protein LOC113272442 [Papaver somniferum]|uniref:uncharacterized protein LOC113272442 n=1 Tax=Papaver somniferum TaxID=3469 RepID=UPI000E6FFA36|nr:uncharacterized protein LOC113272442 [Papaver somniferum]
MSQVPVPANLHAYAGFVPVFNGSNFTEWSDHVKFSLAINDLDRCLTAEKPAALTDTSSADDKRNFDVWERSNRLNLMLIRMTIFPNIRTSIPVIDTAVELLKEIDARFRVADKSLAGTLMAKLTTMKYDGSRGMQEHIKEITNIVAKLNALDMTVAEGFLVRFILNSLPLLYDPFQINYNSLKEKWNVNELSNMLVQEEARLKQ